MNFINKHFDVEYFKYLIDEIIGPLFAFVGVPVIAAIIAILIYA